MVKSEEFRDLVVNTVEPSMFKNYKTLFQDTLAKRDTPKIRAILAR